MKREENLFMSISKEHKEKSDRNGEKKKSMWIY